ncbi:CPBP family intramembrane glutamic endopeptidase [Desulfitobacterium chlororespirans]|uniref:CAAX protease self-immunity n=1 Tax=Desulfitobacterium chlororespirans DSM 11544 TaxID=1121395 RepID=A0A1M7TIK0_9FIRM|nr:type II CAAX endopeptidase family protein [Desulfitobacterium chlororespirans]SHN70526.1 CAAX protease self-immunity [Desulfitobacterium chlororespirans DSM 11544]
MEQEKSAAKKRLIIFVALTMGISWLVFLLIPICGLTYGSGWAVILLAAAMFIPALCNILTRFITKEGFGNMYLKPNFKGNGKRYLLIYFGPTVLLFLSAAFYFLIFPGSFDTELAILTELTEPGSAAGLSPVTLLIVQVLMVLLIGPVINIIPTLGEELGWRGYLLPKLRGFFSDRAALTITGVIWGIWHLPIIAMGHNYGTGYWGYPWLGILAMIVFCVVLGIIEGYAFIKLGSVIPAAMIHSVVNAGAAFPIYLAKDGYNTLLGPAITGLIGGLPFIALALVLFLKCTRQRPHIQ